MIAANDRSISIMRAPRRAVLALGGGGARGLAHFGAVQAVQEAGFVLDRIVGTSIGSLVGALCATEPSELRAASRVREYVTSPEFASQQASLCGANPKTNTSSPAGMLAWFDRIKSYLWARHLLSRVYRRRSLLSGHVLEEVIAALVPDIDITEASTPLSIIAVDLRFGQQIVLEKGPLRKAILASAAIPGIFPPVEWDDMLLCDIGVLESLPTEVAQSYHGDLMIAVDIGPSLERAVQCDSALHVLLRIDEIGERLYRRYSLSRPDILISPNVGRFPWFDFTQPDRLIQAGLDAGRTAIRTWLRHQPTVEPTGHSFRRQLSNDLRQA